MLATVSRGITDNFPSNICFRKSGAGFVLLRPGENDFKHHSGFFHLYRFVFVRDRKSVV